MASGVELAEVDLGVDEEPTSASAAITSDRAVELVGFGSFHVWLTLILTLGNAADAVEVLSIALVLPNLTHLSDADKGALTAAVFAGALVGAVAWGLAGDLVGRRPALVASLLLNGLFALASSAVGEHLGALCACRFFAGIGVAGTNAVAFTLLPEFLPASKRGVGVVVLASGWMCGSVYSAAVGWSVIPKRGWRAFLAASSAPALVAAAAAAARVPESPRFLCARGRCLEAAAVMRAVSRRTKKSRLPEDFFFEASAKGKARLFRRDEKKNVFGSRVFAPARALFFAAPARRARFLALAATWFALSFGWYGTMLWLPEYFARSSADVSHESRERVTKRVYVENLLVALANLPGNLASAYSVDAVGRVRTLLFGTCGACASALAFAGIVAVAGGDGSGGDFEKKWVAFVLCASTFNALSVGGWNALDLLSAESFPTSSRATAMGAFGAVGRVGAFAGTSAMGLVGVSVGGEAPLYAPFLVAAAAMALAALAAGRAEETAGRKLGAGDDDDDDDDDDDRLRGDAGDAGALLGRAALRSSAEADTA
jgi:MFS family permease